MKQNERHPWPSDQSSCLLAHDPFQNSFQYIEVIKKPDQNHHVFPDKNWQEHDDPKTDCDNKGYEPSLPDDLVLTILVNLLIIKMTDEVVVSHDRSDKCQSIAGYQRKIEDKKDMSLHHSHEHPGSFQHWFGILGSHARDSTYTSLPHMRRNLGASDEQLRRF